MDRISQFREDIQDYQSKGLTLFTTSSFQTHSLVLLHLISRYFPEIPVFFIHTGYHFPETLQFRTQIAADWHLDVRDIRSATPRNMQKDSEGRLLFASDPEHCCSLNKTQPTEELLRRYDIWINGVRRDQSSVRKSFNKEEKAPHGAVRYHPMLDWTAKEIWQYRKEHGLPAHPLDAKGYMSIGCEPCTRRVDNDLMEREARWYGMSKTECGLHTDLINKTT